MNDDIDSTIPADGLKLRQRKWYELKWLYIILATVIVLAGIITSAILWYQAMLKPVSSLSEAVMFTVDDGQTARSIGRNLEKARLIKSELAFDIYARLHGGALQTGTYHLDRSMTTQKVYSVLLSGKQADYNITFFPGANLQSAQSVPQSQRLDVTTVLERAGFSDSDIKRALATTYQLPLFAGKPASADLEGYIYGETYNVSANSTAEQILTKTFNTFYQQLQDNGLLDKIKAHKLTLYQAITLGSIIQREASDPADQRQIAQVFYKRLNMGMPLGSDVTFMYAAAKLGVPATPDLKSPYNTRIHTGLPPGPIAVPGLSAMEAVASPAKGDYLYFVAGDDGTVHFARTNAEHEDNIAKYCHQLCS